MRYWANILFPGFVRRVTGRPAEWHRHSCLWPRFHRQECLCYFPALVLSLLLIPAARGQDGATLRDAARQLGFETVEEYVPEGVLDGFRLPTEEEWRRFWTGVESALESGDLEELAWMRPEAERALDLLDSIPGGAPYADWLVQRLDYFEVAEWATKRVPSGVPPPARPRPTPATGRVSVVPPPGPKPAPVPPAVARKRTEAVTDLELWKEKTRGRPAPSRSGRLVPALKRIFSAEGVPPELVWLAEVESSFNPEAKSPVGALGLYQFMPATGRSLGLGEGPPDERTHPEKSGRAAARYLKKLYRRFDSWPLALAAYNAGEGRVGRLLKEQGAATFSAIAGHLPSETRMYVPKVLATVYHREGIEPEKIPPPAGG